ncbi:hypothetical protein [Bradyrhizobium sp.]|uniref:hypothetical protein n=1 Tax=Bradyrhizobium sp. TaxID=376 RepID=UPI003C4F1865
MALSQQTLRIVWGEARRLIPTDGADNTKARLQAVIAALATRDSSAAAANFAAPVPLPPVGSPSGAAAAQMVASVESAVEFGQQGGRALPKRAVLWETAKTGEPVETQRSLPPSAAWIKDATAAHTSTFGVDGDATHRIFTLFESDAEPKRGDPAFVSGLTGSGLPSPRRSGHPVSVPWILGIVAGVLFFWMLASLSWTGHSVKQARDLMAGTLPVVTGAYLEKLDAGCKANGNVCNDAFDAGATSPQTDKATYAAATCIKTPESGDSPLHTSAFCQYAWSLALTAANSGNLAGVGTVLSAVLGWPVGISQRTGTLSLAFPMAGLIASIALLGIALGLGTQGNIFGVWISPQKRISLARMQVSLWTVVVLGAYATVALFNSGMLAELIQAAQQNGNRQSLLETLVTFPTMPAAILTALGIAVVSPMVSALIKGDVGSTASDIAIGLADDSQIKDNSGVGRFIDQVKGDGSNLEVRDAPEKASLADLFLGETNDSKNLVDVSRLQNVLITLILVCGYGTLLFDMVRDIAPETLVGALNSSKSLFPTLPSPGAVFTTLLAASHGTYLVSKAAAK